MNLTTKLILVKSNAPITNINNQSGMSTLLKEQIITITTVSSGIKGDKGDPGAAYTQRLIYKQITAQNITDKNIVLSETPLFPLQVEVIPVGGIHQQINVDFIVMGNIIDWDSLALENLVEAGAFLIIGYQVEL